MKSYLSLIPISAKVHKRQNRMTLFCIIIAVFLVTAIFSMADMGVRMEKTRLIKEHGNWHVMLKNISEEDAAAIGARSDVAAASWYDVINYGIDEAYFVGSKKAALCGVEEALVNDIMDCVTEGRFPQTDQEIMLTANVKNSLDVHIGDHITLQTPSGDVDCTVSGFTEDTNLILQYDAVGVFMNPAAFDKICDLNNRQDAQPVYYVQFEDHTNIRKIIADLKDEYGWTDENLSENTAVLGITGFSSDSYLMGLYGVAAVLFLFVLLAGVLMIAGSINSNIAQRTQFFGMMRCIGASRRQIIRFVRLEALNWCKIAIPIGIGLGIAMTWGICAVLRFGIGGEFLSIPVVAVSAVGVVSGIVVGFLTVWLAARAPAKRAAKVSPVAAVSGARNEKTVRHGAHTRFSKVETALGIHHAVSAKRNLLLMTGSFALSILLFLSFSAVLDWTHHALTPLRPYAPDLSIISTDRSCTVDRNLISEIEGRSGVKRVFGRMFRGGIPVSSNKNVEQIDLISYEENQLHWAEEDLLRGDLAKVSENSDAVLTVYDKTNPLDVGDKIQLYGTEVEVAALLSDSPFDNTEGTPTVICSEETFMRLTDERDYAVIDVQLTNDATDQDTNAIRNLAGENFMFSDRRESNRASTGTYWAFTLLVYGFLSIIAMITVFYIVNSISMSVSAKIKQYGAMRAVGMDSRQMTKMIAAEAGTYALTGCVVGCVFGLPLNRFLFEQLVTAYWGDAWQIPVLPVVIILLLVFAATAAAVYAPAKRVANMSVVKAIANE